MANQALKPTLTDIVTRPASSGNLLEAAFERLPKEQRQRLMEKALEEKLRLDVEAARAEGRNIRNAVDMQRMIHVLQDLESSTNRDFTLQARYETASGNTSVEVKKSTNNTIVIVAVVIAIVFLAFSCN